MIDLIDILNNAGVNGVNLLKESVRPFNATGETERSIRYEVTENGNEYHLTFYGRRFFKALETGRGPRESSDYSKFDLSLDKWLEAKNFQKKTSRTGKVYYKIGESWMTAKSLAYRINKEGDKTHRIGGREVYSKQLDDFVSKMIDSLKTQALNKILLSVNIKK